MGVLDLGGGLGEAHPVGGGGNPPAGWSPRRAGPQEKFWEGFRFPSQPHLETTKGEACGPLLWKPLGGWTRERGLRGTLGRGTGDGGGAVAAIRGILPWVRRGWGGFGSFGGGRAIIALRGTGVRTRDADCHVALLLAMTVLKLCHSEEARRADVGIRFLRGTRGAARRT